MDRVLVTGGNGLMGRHCLPLLVERGFEVHAVTRQSLPGILGTRKGADPFFAPSSVRWHHLDLLEPGSIDVLLECVRPTHLLHLAWYTAPGSFWASPENRVWLETSLELFRKFEQLGGKRIVGTGSCAEYDWSAGVCRENSTPCRPDTLYGRTKLAAATYLNAIHSAGGPSTAWARLFFLYGPEASSRRMPGVVISALSRGEPVECSAGTQQRDFLFVPDAADAVVTLVQSDVSGPVNVCSGEPIAIRDLAQRTAALMGRPDLLRLGANANTANEVPLVAGDRGRLANELNWKPRFSLEEGLRQTVEETAGSLLARSA